MNSLDRFGIYWRMFGKYIPFFTLALLFIILVFVFIYYSRVKRAEQTKTVIKKRTFLEFIITCMISAILFVSLSPTTTYLTYQYSIQLRLTPLFQGDIEYIINVFMYTILACLISFRLNSSKTLFVCIGLSFVIEVTQYLIPTGRMMSITDFVLNTIGALIGIFLMLPIHSYRKKETGRPI